MTFDFYTGSQAEQFSFIRIPKLLLLNPEFRGLSIQAKMLYAVLLDRMSLSVKNHWMDDQDRVYIIYQVEEIVQDIGFTKRKVMDVLTELEQFGLVARKRRGRGLPNYLYVKNFLSGLPAFHSTGNGQAKDVHLRTSADVLPESRSADTATSRQSAMNAISADTMTKCLALTNDFRNVFRLYQDQVLIGKFKPLSFMNSRCKLFIVQFIGIMLDDTCQSCVHSMKVMRKAYRRIVKIVKSEE